MVGQSTINGIQRSSSSTDRIENTAILVAPSFVVVHQSTQQHSSRLFTIKDPKSCKPRSPQYILSPSGSLHSPHVIAMPCQLNSELAPIPFAQSPPHFHFHFHFLVPICSSPTGVHHFNTTPTPSPASSPIPTG
jgi:hypothetical protein